MAKSIDPEKQAKTTKPAVAGKPAATKPGAAKQAPKGQGAAQSGAEDEAVEKDGEESLSDRLLKDTPAWAVSMLVHIVALLLMALIVTKPDKKPAVVAITSSPAEEEEPFEEFEEEMPVDNPVESTEPVAETAITHEVVIENVVDVSDASDTEAAPLAMEITDFGDISAPATDMLSTVGVVGGTAPGGYGGRKNAGALARGGGGGGDTESAVDRALKWLAEHQMADGGWSFDLKECPSCQGKCKNGGMRNDRGGATALALLPFLGRGYTHKEGPYKKQLESGFSWLAKKSAENDGKCYDGEGSMYSQGLAGIALSEAFAMSQDNRLQNPAQMALYFIEKAQDEVGGGWRYRPNEPGDTSAVGWQLMALKSGHMSYLNVNPATIKKAIKFLDSVEDDSGAFYGYMGPGRGLGTTSVGLLSRMYLGWRRENPSLQRGVEFLAQKGPTSDLYYDYYATQIMHHVEGDIWTTWNGKMKPMLLKAQATEGHEAGSWHKGFEGGHDGNAGRLYTTALATMILEVYYRHQPLYRGQATEQEFQE